MKGINLNSDTDVSMYIWNKIYGRLTYLTPTYERVPIYLVDEPTMDRIHPPERSLNMDILKERFPGIRDRLKEEAERMREELENKEKEKAQNNEAQRPRNRDQQTERSRPVNEREGNREEELPRWASIIEEGLNACFTSQMSALGVYFHDFQPQQELADDLTEILEERTKYDKALKQQILAQHPHYPAGEVIFICPKRIYRHEKPELLFQKVVIHELAHAYVGGERNEDYRRGYGRVIEESLANAVALSHFCKKETPALKAFIASQPPEYRGCYFWMEERHKSRRYYTEWESYNDGVHDHLRSWARYPGGFLFPIFDESGPYGRFADYVKWFVYRDFFHPDIRVWWRLHKMLYHLFPDKILDDAFVCFKKRGDMRPFCNLISLAILQFIAEQG